MSLASDRMSDKTRLALLAALSPKHGRTVQEVAERTGKNVARVRVNLRTMMLEGSIMREEQWLPGGGRCGLYKRIERLSPHVPLYPDNTAINFEPLARCFGGYTYRI